MLRKTQLKTTNRREYDEAFKADAVILFRDHQDRTPNDRIQKLHHRFPKNSSLYRLVQFPTKTLGDQLPNPRTVRKKAALN